MHYQVVARNNEPSGAWDYYPYWAPVRDKDAATRLASYAAQTGYEAAILQSVTVEMLQRIARAVVEQHDAHLLPALRFLPDARVAAAPRYGEHGVETELRVSAGLDPYIDGPDKPELDSRRLTLEKGPGGDVTIGGLWQRQPMSIPRRMDVLQAWMSLRRRMLQGQLGGPTDGSGAARGGALDV